MTEIILHAGFHKTGSSSIQRTFHAHEFDGVEYLDWGHFNHSHPFMQGFLDTRGPEVAKAARDKLVAGMAKVTAPKVIISAEAFAVAGYRDAIEQMCDLIAPYTSRIKVYAYIRPPGSLLASDFQQCARAGVNVEFGRTPEYLQRMSVLDDIFGRVNVWYGVFARQCLMHGCVVRDFGARIGFPVQEDQVQQSNESFPLEAVALARCNALFGDPSYDTPENPDYAYFASQKLKDIGDTKFRFSSEAIEKHTAPHVHEMKSVQRRIGGMFPPVKAVPGGVSSDEDLFDIALTLEPKLLKVVEAYAAQVPGGDFAAQALGDAQAQPPGPQRIADTVDVIKMLRAVELKAREAA